MGPEYLNHSEFFLQSSIRVAERISRNSIDIEKLVDALVDLRKRRGRVFFLGVGGSAANCSHAVNDFRKLCNIESYTPTDNASELTARINDDGWDSVFAEWLKGSNLRGLDALMVFSVGGGNREKNVSVNIVNAIDYAVSRGSEIYGIVGRTDGHIMNHATHVIPIITEHPKLVTPLTEAYQAMIWHCLVSHPKLQQINTKW